MTPVQSWAMVVAAIMIAVIIWQGIKSRGRCWDIKVKNRGPIPYDKPDIVPGLLDSSLLAILMRNVGWQGRFWDKRVVKDE